MACYNDLNAGDGSIGMDSFGKSFGFVYPAHFGVLTRSAMHPSVLADIRVGIRKWVPIFAKITNFSSWLYPNIGQDLLKAKPSVATVFDDRASYANLFSQVCSSISYPFNGNYHGSSSVYLLFRACGPLDIFRRVIPVIINPVQGIFRAGFRTNVGNKVIVGQCPSITDLNAPTPVVSPRPVIRRAAPIFHILPRAIERLRMLERHGFLAHFGKAFFMTHDAKFYKGNEVA